MMMLAPAPTAMLIGTVIAAGVGGYFIGASSTSRLVSGGAFTSSMVKRTRVANYDDEEESEEEEIEEEFLDHAPNWSNSIKDDEKDGLKSSPVKSERFKSKLKYETKSTEECKMVLVVRSDLGMTKGKIAAQCAHAALACYKRLLFSNPASQTLRKWEKEGQAKVALQVKSQDELLKLHTLAISLDLIAELITDAGRTQIASGSQTVLGIGPAPKSIIDQVTGNLKLL